MTWPSDYNSMTKVTFVSITNEILRIQNLSNKP